MRFCNLCFISPDGVVEQVTGKVILIDEYLADSMAYEIDRPEDMWSLADYVAKGS